MNEAEREFPQDLIDRLAGFVSAHLGLDFTATRQRDLVRGLRAACRDLSRTSDETDPVACMESLLGGPPPTGEQLKVLASHLTVGETYFFRTRSFFDTLQGAVVPRLAERAAREGRPLRLWSAGCSSGEEAYSLAILLDRMKLLKNAGEEAGRQVLGTDINPVSLAKATSGAYSEWSFRDTPAWLKHEYFEPVAKGRYTISSRIRKSVRFLPLNLARDPYPDLANGTAQVDLILCRHVLMYFRKPAADEVVRRLRLCLREGGALIVSPTEIAHLNLSQLREERVEETLVHWNDAGPVLPRPYAFPPAAQSPPAPASPASPLWKPVPPASPAPPPPPPEPALLRPAPPAAEDASDLRMALESAQKHYTRGEYAETVRTLAPLLSKPAPSPQRLEGFLLAARSCANLGHFEEALLWNSGAIETSRMHPEPHYLMATILLELGRTGEAIEALRRVLYLSPDFAPAQLALARASFMTENRAEAVRVIRRLLEGLSSRPADEELPGSEGLTVSALRSFATAMLEQASEPQSADSPRRGRRTR